VDGPEIGQPAPEFTLPSPEGDVALSQLVKSGKVVIAFYQEDNTPMCRNELANFKNDHDLFGELNAQVIAISADSVESHERFDRDMDGFPFPLLSDPDLEVARRYGVVDDTGKRTRRAVFVIDEEGKVRHKIPFYNPSNLRQFEEIFEALGYPQVR
jgi:peroxiredoxin Q/BCP